jgi:valyl-tRNA synthetase
MVMTGEEFLGDKPFADVYIHATILDEHGRRMSKSKGNGVDPVDLINLYGADALRYTLMSRAGQVQDIRIKPIKDGRQEQVEQARNFANKIWNASRFALMNLGDYTPPHNEPSPTALVDRWILSRLDATAETMRHGFDTYNLDESAKAVYEFFWDEFCDWYIEAAKPRFQGEDADQAKHVLWFVLERSLRLLHPIMPYLTEAIWQSLPGAKERSRSEFLMFTSFPAGLGLRDETAEDEWALVQEVTRAIRNLQAENNLKKGGIAFFSASSARAKAVAAANVMLIKSLTRSDELDMDTEAPGESLLAPTRFGDVRLPRPEASPEEVALEKGRIEKELAKIAKDLEGLNARLEKPSFIASAPEAVVAKARQQAAELIEKRDKLNARIADLRA